MRLITAPCVGIVVGALVEGVLFALLTIFDSSEANFALSRSESVLLATIIGMIGGSFLGGIIGLVVALREAEGPSGLLLGSAIGLAFGILLAIRVGLGGPVADPYMIVVLSTVPAGASIGFVSAVLTVPSTEPQPSRSHRIFD